MHHPAPPFDLDTLIIGAGPAGLQLGYYLEKAGRRYLVVERSDKVGSFFRRFPRSRGLISFNKTRSIYRDPEINLRWDWNSLLTDDYSHPFGDFSRDFYPHAGDMVRYLESFHRTHNIQVRFGFTVTRIAREGVGYRVTDADGNTLSCRCLVVATGMGRPHIPDIPGIEHAEGYEEVSFKADDYLDQRVLIIGKGNSGFELAERILPTAAIIHIASPQPIRMAWKTRHPGHLRAQYTSLLDAYQLKTLHSALDCDILDIRRLEDGKLLVTVRYTHADGEVDEIVYDRVVRATGFCFDGRLFDPDCRPQTIVDGRLPDMSPVWESRQSPNLFFAGTLMQARDFRQSSSAFIDGFRYNVRSLFHVLEERYFAVPAPGRTLALDPAKVAHHILQRVCRASSLWTQFGYLSDTLVVDRQRQAITYREDVPVAVVGEGLEAEAEVYTVTLEWGRWEGDVFAIDRHPHHDRADASVFLHPIVRRYHHGGLVAEVHLLEDLLGVYGSGFETGMIRSHNRTEIEQYHREQHDAPLLAWLTAHLGEPARASMRVDALPAQLAAAGPSQPVPPLV